MKSKWIIWVVVAAAIVGVVFLLTRPASNEGTGAIGSGSSGQGIVDVDAAKVQELADAGDVRVVDVRTAGEYEAGHIKGAENVPVDQVANAVRDWDRNAPLLVYCATGARSSSAVSQLQSMGFKTIYHFADGLVAWQGALDTGGSQQTAQSEPVKTSGTPVMYEFFTDW